MRIWQSQKNRTARACFPCCGSVRSARAFSARLQREQSHLKDDALQ